MDVHEFDADAGDTFRMTVTGVSPDGMQVMLVADDDYNEFKKQQESDAGTVAVAFTAKGHLTEENPVWSTLVPATGKWRFLYYRNYVTSINFERIPAKK